MHFSTATIIAALASLSIAAPLESRSADFTAPKGSGSFVLQVIATVGNLNFSGNWLSPYHTGAGTNALVLDNDQSYAQKFNFTKSTGDISATLGDYQYYLNLATSNIYAPPKHYSFAGFDIDNKKPGNKFSFTSPDNYLQFPAGGDQVWAVCPAIIYANEVYVDTLVFREPTAKRNMTCADVRVKAVFV